MPIHVWDVVKRKIGKKKKKDKAMTENAEQQQENMTQIKCAYCGRFLGFHAIVQGLVEILCPKCKGWTVVSSIPKKTIDNLMKG